MRSVPPIPHRGHEGRPDGGTNLLTSLETAPVRVPVGAAAPAPGRPVRLGRFGLAVLLVLALGLAVGLIPRWQARRHLTAQMAESDVLTVAVVSPTPTRPDVSMPLPAEVTPYFEAPILARASGYLKRWLVDIGERVRAGQLLAEIETPDLDQELLRARAQVLQAQAALDLARITAARWTELLKTASVSEQETAEKQADFALKTASLQAAQAEVKRLEELKGFASVTAPFAGVITLRDTDIGQLITAGSGRELFRLAQVQPLRVYVHVPQTYAQAVTVGQHADLTFTELPGRHFDATVVRTAGAMQPDSRTLLVELQTDNAQGQILAGAYAQVQFRAAEAAPVLTLPADTLLFRAEGTQVGIVTADHRVELRAIKMGRDFGRTMEVIEGVKPGDQVILNPPDSLTAGVPVRLATAEAPAARGK